MIRTRDLVLFLVAIVFLAVAITFTLPNTQSTSDNTSITEFEDSPAPQLVGKYEERTIDRSSVIERLRAAIANDEVIYSSEPIDQDVDAELEPTETESPDSAVVVLRCVNQIDPLALARVWPRANVSVQVAEGVRSVALIEVTESPSTVGKTGSSSAVAEITPVTRVVPLLRLPLYPVVTDPHCLESEIVGVTIDGALLFNSDAIAYRSRSNSELIGYARDGFPIYGNYSGPTDECGGYELGGTYRYSVSNDRNFILGCYKSEPVKFVNE